MYDKFFATAFKKTVDKLGIVYTPIEIVDFILHSADKLLRENFGEGLTDEGVHILDGFTGTGTFIVRLLQSGLIRPEDSARKYANELHGNEILLLAYYIAAVNIETTYYDVMTLNAAPGGGKQAADTGHEYVEFPGLVLTDTFQSWEDDDTPDLDVFPENNDRLERLKKLPITVIVGNPPYSAKQGDGNQNNPNDRYPSLDNAIRETYAERSTATNKNSLYDSYIRAIKWASLRIHDRGVIAFVTNGGFLDSTTMDGLRASLLEEYSAVYVFNLRGNQRSADWRKEGGKVFDAGSQATVAITVLVKKAGASSASEVHYAQTDDYMTRDEKLALVADCGSLAGLGDRMSSITPNSAHDWLDQRADDFDSFVPAATRGRSEAIFGVYSGGLGTSRDVWVYASSVTELRTQIERHNETYNGEVRRWRSNGMDGDDKAVQGWALSDPAQVSWSRSLRTFLRRGDSATWSTDAVTIAGYRPFFKQRVYFDHIMNHERSQLPRLFASPSLPQVGFYLPGVGSTKAFSTVMVDVIPDLNLWGSEGGQFIPRWGYEKVEVLDVLDVDVDGTVIDGYRRLDNVTDSAFLRFTAVYEEITKDDIFFYVYGLLHSPEYRETYAANLKKMLPRIPLVEDPWPFVEAGRKLSQLHLAYESVKPYALDGLDTVPTAGEDPYELYRVQRMAFAKVRSPETGKLVAERSSVIYNSRITLGGIPEEAYRYRLGSRSAVEWIMDRYQVKTDKASGIVNDPNDWSREVGDPRYIVDLVARIVTVSVETMRIVDALPLLDIITA